MMKCIMRLDKSQVPSLIKHTEGAGNFNRDLQLMAGYRRYDVLLVGGAGGASGNVQASPAGGSSGTAYGSGGGGGGTLKAWGRLQDLGTLTAYSVGQAGTVGANKTGNNSRANPGGHGTDSVFGAYTAERGTGSVGSMLEIAGSFFGYELGTGGNGGGNSADLGSIGLGGGDRAGGAPVDAATAGTWEFGSPNPVTGGVIGGSGGGGGGVGRIGEGGGSHVSPQAGAAAGPSEYAAPGGPVVSYRGGCGGGGNLALLTAGANEFYGSNQAGHSPGGLVALKFS